MSKKYLYYFEYFNQKHGWYFSDRLSQLRGPYESLDHASAALGEYLERLELERMGTG